MGVSVWRSGLPHHTLTSTAYLVLFPSDFPACGGECNIFYSRWSKIKCSNKVLHQTMPSALNQLIPHLINYLKHPNAHSCLIMSSWKPGSALFHQRQKYTQYSSTQAQPWASVVLWINPSNLVLITALAWLCRLLGLGCCWTGRVAHLN